jgi:rhodanese-related sulfurtransferase
MNWTKHFIEAATLIVAAAVCALVSNAVASRERKLVIVNAAQSPPRGGQPPTAVPPPPTPAPDSGGPLSSTTSAAPAVPARVNRQPVTTTRQPENPTTRQPTTDNRQPTDRFPPHPDKAYVELHGDDVAWLHSKGVLFLDARRTSVYEQGHIPGARPFSVWESDIDEKVNKLYAERSDPKDQNLPIVIYCSGGDCEDSHMLAQKLWGIQFNNVYVYKDGFPDWQRRGEPIHTGANP